MEAIQWNDEFTVEITSQAVAVLSQSKYSIEDFKRWIKDRYRFSLGGNNITVFLEKMSREEEQRALEQKNNLNDSKVETK